MRIKLWSMVACCIWLAVLAEGTLAADSKMICLVHDAKTGSPLACRVYVRSSDGKWLFARSIAEGGSAVEYQKSRFASSVEMHTTVSAGPFAVDVPPGRYTVRVERGKEYLPWEKTVAVDADELKLSIPLVRWIDMAAEGWYSGDTHVHRSLEDLPNLLLAEDLNVGLPLTHWMTRSHTAPGSGDKSTEAVPHRELVRVDSTHVIWPMNTEYEIFSVRDKRHTLGAVLILGHKEPFEIGVPPVRPVANAVRQQGGVLDLDKHSWPWSLMIAPVMDVNLFELANNHCWRTEFGFRQWTVDTAPAYMNLERDERGLTEWGWIDFGFQSYYALLNCGFPMRPSAGTANGVHPVPLGFGRVYVHLPQGFDFERWMEGLAAGRSFVTTGPMLFVRVNDESPGASIRLSASGSHECQVKGTVTSGAPIRPIEMVVNGRVVQRLPAKNTRTPRDGYESAFDCRVPIGGSSWIAVRVFEDRPDDRIRFAHSSPVHVEIPNKPLRPRREEVEYLVHRMKQEHSRNAEVLEPASLEEYREALRTYEQSAAGAR